MHRRPFQLPGHVRQRQPVGERRVGRELPPSLLQETPRRPRRFQIDQGGSHFLHLRFRKVAAGRLLDVGQHLLGVRLLAVIAHAALHQRLRQADQGRGRRRRRRLLQPRLELRVEPPLVRPRQLQPNRLYQHQVGQRQSRRRPLLRLRQQLLAALLPTRPELGRRPAAQDAVRLGRLIQVQGGLVLAAGVVVAVGQAVAAGRQQVGRRHVRSQFAVERVRLPGPLQQFQRLAVGFLLQQDLAQPLQRRQVVREVRQQRRAAFSALSFRRARRCSWTSASCASRRSGANSRQRR